MLHDALLVPHVIAGTAGLLVGPLAMAVPKRAGWHTRVGLAYQGAAAVMTTTAVALAVLDPARLWWLALIAIATEAAALAGWRERRRRAPGWLGRHVRLMCGSYLSFVTAFLVVNLSTPLAWVVPTVVGSPLIALAAARARRPAPASRPAAPASRPAAPAGAPTSAGVPGG